MPNICLILKNKNHYQEPFKVQSTLTNGRKIGLNNCEKALIILSGIIGGIVFPIIGNFIAFFGVSALIKQKKIKIIKSNESKLPSRLTLTKSPSVKNDASAKSGSSTKNDSSTKSMSHLNHLSEVDLRSFIDTKKFENMEDEEKIKLYGMIVLKHKNLAEQFLTKIDALRESTSQDTKVVSDYKFYKFLIDTIQTSTFTPNEQAIIILNFIKWESYSNTLRIDKASKLCEKLSNLSIGDHEKERILTAFASKFNTDDLDNFVTLSQNKIFREFLISHYGDNIRAFCWTNIFPDTLNELLEELVERKLTKHQLEAVARKLSETEEVDENIDYTCINDYLNQKGYREKEGYLHNYELLEDMSLATTSYNPRYDATDHLPTNIICTRQDYPFAYTLYENIKSKDIDVQS